MKGETLKVKAPKIEVILGDKLTAFAPNTTGVNFNYPRIVEGYSHQVFKQLFDIAQLFGMMEGYQVVKYTYVSVVKKRGDV